MCLSDKLFDLSDHVEWSPADQEAALRHQLAARIETDVAAFVVGAAEEVGEMTVGAALLAERTSVAVLVAIKSFAKSHRDAPSSPLRGMPATVLYFAAIAAAKVSGVRGVTSLAEAAQREGFLWGMKQRGTDELHELFSQAACR